MKEYRPLFITATAEDALAIIEKVDGTGAEVLPLDRPDSVAVLMEYQQDRAPAILAFDRTEEGKNTAERIMQAAPEGWPIWNTAGSLCGDSDTITSAAKKDAAGFQQCITDALRRLYEVADAAGFFDEPPEDPAQEPKEDKLRTFFEKIQTEAYKPHETGLQFFDNLLDGGIMQQSVLTVMAAPSVGKTTLCQQIAEELADRKTKVAYLNFEMSYEQMIAKALSYRMAKEGRRLTADEILKGYNWTDTPRERVTRAYNEYRNGPAKFIDYEGGVAPTLDGLREYLKNTGEAAKKKGEPAPAVIADYLQLIVGEGDNEAKTVKAAITALKDYAKDYNTFVVCIVAVNRGSYSRITLESGRDSSGIEYTGDYILSLQYYDIDQELKDKWTQEDLGKLQRETWRRLIIRVLKHRLGGGQGRSAKVYCNSAYNYFVGEKQEVPNWPEKDLKARSPFIAKTPEPEPKKKAGEKMKKKDLEAAADAWELIEGEEAPF